MAEEGKAQTPRYNPRSSKQFIGEENTSQKLDAASLETVAVDAAGQVSNLERLKSITTINVMSSAPTIQAEPARIPDSIAIHLPGRTDPLIFNDQYEISLGRCGASSLSLPDVDLSLNHGVLLGVSREHAVIRRTDEGYVIEDLGSTNGTWVNAKRLAPYDPCALHHGDQLRLAEQILFVYFSFGDQDVIHTLVLKDCNQSGTEPIESGLLVPYLLEKAGIYVRALANIQHILDQAQNQLFAAEVENVGRHANGQWIEINIRGAGQAIEVVRTTVEELPSLYDQGPPEPDSVSWPGEGIPSDSSASSYTYKVAAKRIINAVAPDLIGDRFYELVRQLLPHIATIVDSNFAIVSCGTKQG